jgi:hypothetical protein
MKVDPVMDAVELHNADEDEIDRNDVAQQPRHQENEYPGNDGNKRSEMGSGNDHWFSSKLKGTLGLKTWLAQKRAKTG